MKPKLLNLIVFVFLLSTLITFAQKDTNLSEANKILFAELKEKEDLRTARVKAFLASNPNIKPVIDKENGHTAIYDVHNGTPIYKTTYNLLAARATKASHLQVGGSLNLDLQGSGMTVGVWDGGPVQASHPEFQNASNSASRVIVIDNVRAISAGGGAIESDHGTHVAGTIGAKGVDSQAKGMATDVTIKSYNWDSDTTEMLSAVNDPTNPIIISNHSYGIPVVANGITTQAWVMGTYTADARSIDQIARNNPKYLIVASAGNSGQQSYSGGMFPGYDKLTSDKNAKNSLVLANANPSLVPFSNDLQAFPINSSSSQGPTDDMRIKPDIAADGTALYSSTTANGYSSFTGTSMSAPNATGSLLLVQEYYNNQYGEYMNSATLKGLACHLAIDDAQTIGPDPVFGWGFLDVKAMVETLMAADNNTAIVEERSLAHNTTYTTTFSAQSGDNIRASISWTDLPGAFIPVGTANNTSPRLVHDLDLRVTFNGTTFMPWKLDFDPSTGYSNSKADNITDNIERVDFVAPSSGTYTLTVSHKGLIKVNNDSFLPGSQDYSLFLTGNNISLSVDDNEAFSKFNMYPNPSNNLVNILFEKPTSDDVEISLFDISGRNVYNNIYRNTQLQFSTQINVSSLSKGIYLVNIKSADRNINRRLIVR